MARTAKVLMAELLEKEGRELPGKNTYQVAVNLLKEWGDLCSSTIDDVVIEVRAARRYGRLQVSQKKGVQKAFRTLLPHEREQLKRAREIKVEREQQHRGKPRYHRPRKHQAALRDFGAITA